MTYNIIDTYAFKVQQLGIQLHDAVSEFRLQKNMKIMLPTSVLITKPTT